MPEVLSPFVYWAQTESNLTLKVDLKDVKNPYVQLENKKLQFGAQGYGARGLNKYAFTLDFHSAIDPEESHYKVYDRNVDFTLKKKESGWWPRITGMPQKPAWLKIDFDRWKSEEDVEDDDESRDIMEDYPNMYNKLEKEELGYKRDSIEGTYEAVGGPMKFCQLMQFLEVMHPMFGYTKGGFVVPLLQVLGRSIILFCMIDAEPRMHTKPVIFYLFLIWSIVEFVRNIPYFEETQRFTVSLPNSWNFAFHCPTAMRIYLLILFFPGMYMMMSHMYKARVKKLSPKKYHSKAH
uniref:very-long-chain (3R)-3-hydroxyacyl-CoA dehydratase n=1 Tax=Timema cristinae TaxID=61476 RepID=A0A7R9GSC2_TIMCR|nr:unnamed protein product [Timema cristinae]